MIDPVADALLGAASARDDILEFGDVELAGICPQDIMPPIDWPVV